MQDDLLNELREQTRWLRLLGLQSLKSAISDVITTETHRKVYELSDGKRTTRAIASDAGVSPSTVSRLWKTWHAQGIVYESHSQPGRMVHLMDPTEIGAFENTTFHEGGST